MSKNEQLEFPKVVTYDIPEPTLTAPFSLYLLFDAHYFSAQCDVKLLKKAIGEIASNPHAAVIIGGDFFDAILPTDKRFDFNILPKEAFENIHNLKYLNSLLIKKGCELLKPVKDKVIVYITGNHEEKASKTYFVDIAGEVGERLGFPVYGYHAYIFLRLRKRNGKLRTMLKVYAHHGWGYGRKPGSKINNLVAISEEVEADIYVSGHTHDYVVYRKLRLQPQNVSCTLKDEEKLFIKVPGLRINWLSDTRETTFEERRAYGYPYRGVPRIDIYYSSQKDSFYYEVRP